MVIAAFDLATATGVCDGAVGASPRMWTWYLSDGGDLNRQHYSFLFDRLISYFDQEPCDRVVYENPRPVAATFGNAKPTFFANGTPRPQKRFMTSEATLNHLRGLIGVFELACEKRGKECEGIAVQEARKAILGWHINNEKKSGLKTKDRVMRDVKLLGADPDNNNEADAAVLWWYAAARSSPAIAVQMTPLFGGAPK